MINFGWNVLAPFPPPNSFCSRWRHSSGHGRYGTLGASCRWVSRSDQSSSWTLSRADQSRSLTLSRADQSRSLAQLAPVCFLSVWLVLNFFRVSADWTNALLCDLSDLSDHSDLSDPIFLIELTHYSATFPTIPTSPTPIFLIELTHCSATFPTIPTSPTQVN